MKLSFFVNEKGRVISSRVKESWLLKHDPVFLDSVNAYVSSNKIKTSRFVEKLWYYFNDMKETVCCKNPDCDNVPSFIGLLPGYLSFCSSKCSNSAHETKAKKEKRSLERYGVSNPYQSEQVKQRIRNTNLSRYGETNPMRSEKIKQKRIKNSIDKTGKPWSLCKGGSADSKKREKSRKSFEEKHQGLTLIQYSDKKFGTCIFYSPECKHTFVINKWQAHLRKGSGIALCTVCNPIGSFNATQWQNEISDFLQANGIAFLKNTRKVIAPLELDFYIESHSIAIELNGLYWHSTEFKDQDYHLNKTQACEKEGIQLIHIFEDEWIYRQEIVKSRLMSLLGITKRKVFARKGKVRQLKYVEAREFLSQNHIQGSVPAQINYGLEIDGELVAVMTFGKLRRALGSKNLEGHYEMYRFCNLMQTSVIGGAGKLLAHFIREHSPEKLISYADRRWSMGRLYEKLGFKKVKVTSPNFWCVSGSHREHRFNHTRKKILAKLSLIDSEKSTDDLLLELSIRKIYDSGNIKFELDFRETLSK